MRRLLPIVFAGAVLAAASGFCAQAEEFPTRPIRLVVAFAPGGATDVVARLFTGPLSAELGQLVVVENITGASGLLGWRSAAGAIPDGYTLLLSENAIAIRPGFKDMEPPFDPLSQLDGIAGMAHSPLVLCVAGNVPADNVKELITYAHSSAKKLNYASSGLNSVAQLVWEVVKDGTKIDAVTVPYRGGGPAMADLVAGQVDLIMASSQVAKPFIDAKKIKALAVTGKERSPVLPDVPTLAEAGVRHADVELQFWFGLFAPKGVPSEVKAKLEKAVERAVASPAMRERLATLDVTADFRTGPALQAQLQSEIKNWSSFIEAKGIKAQ